MEDKRRKNNRNPSAEFIDLICRLYGDSYDDREEDSRPGGEDWAPGQKADHTSLTAFQVQLKQYGYNLSTSKIRKILITGGCWSTERSREAAELFAKYKSVSRVAEELGVSKNLVQTYLPYGKTVYDLDEKSGSAKRSERYRNKRSSRKMLNDFVWMMLHRVYGRVSIEHLKKEYEIYTGAEAPNFEDQLSDLMHSQVFRFALDGENLQRTNDERPWNIEDGYVFQYNLPEKFAEGQDRYYYRELSKEEMIMLMQDGFITTDEVRSMLHILANKHIGNGTEIVAHLWNEVCFGREPFTVVSHLVDTITKKTPFSEDEVDEFGTQALHYANRVVAVRWYAGNSVRGSIKASKE